MSEPIIHVVKINDPHFNTAVCAQKLLLRGAAPDDLLEVRRLNGRLARVGMVGFLAQVEIIGREYRDIVNLRP